MCLARPRGGTALVTTLGLDLAPLRTEQHTHLQSLQVHLLIYMIEQVCVQTEPCNCRNQQLAGQAS